MTDTTPTQPPPEPGGFAMLPKGLLTIWWRLPEHFIRLLPLLLSFDSEKPDQCYPSQTTLGKLINRGRQSVNTTLGQMADAGLIESVPRFLPKRGQTSSVYRRTNWNDPAVLKRVTDWLAAGKGSTCTSATTHRCRAQDATPPVAPKTRHPLSRLGRDTNSPENSPREELACGTSGPAGRPPAASLTDPSPAKYTPAQLSQYEGSTGEEALVDSGEHEDVHDGEWVPVEEYEEAPEPSRPPTVVPAGADADPCASLEAMTAYLTSGDYNWRKFKVSDTDPGVSKWGTREFMGFYWLQVSAYRARQNMPLTVPNWGRLGKHVKGLLQSMTTQHLFDLIRTTYQHFDLICWMLGRLGRSLTFDERTIGNGTVTGAAQALLNKGEIGRAALMAKYVAETSGRRPAA